MTITIIIGMTITIIFTSIIRTNLFTVKIQYFQVYSQKNQHNFLSVHHHHDHHHHDHDHYHRHHHDHHDHYHDHNIQIDMILTFKSIPRRNKMACNFSQLKRRQSSQVMIIMKNYDDHDDDDDGDDDDDQQWQWSRSWWQWEGRKKWTMMMLSFSYKAGKFHWRKSLPQQKTNKWSSS